MADRNATAVVGVARKDGEPGLEFHAVGCADIAKGKRAVYGTFDNVPTGAADYFDDMIAEGQCDLEEAIAECKVLPCVKAVR